MGNDKPEMVAIFLITGIAQPLDGIEDGSIRNADAQDQIAAMLDVQEDSESESSGE